MREALRLASLGEGLTRPNPPVGAVVVRGGRILGEGYHRRAGGPHAEVNAITQAADAARGATLYVTLEPCSTHGRTPPCTDLVLRSGIRRVVCASVDPNPAHAGRGLTLLREAGLRVEQGICQKEGDALIAPFATRMILGRPQLVLKLAATLDGRIADRSGASRWITGPVARARVQEMRRSADAILVGGETVRQDNPSLLPSPRLGRKPYRVICSVSGSIPPDAKLLSDRFASQTVVCVGRQLSKARRAKLEQGGARVVVCDLRDGRLDLDDVLGKLAGLGIMRVLCEGGGVLAASLVHAGLVDELAWFVAPAILGGDARPALAGPGWLIGDRPQLEVCGQEILGPDLLIRCRPVTSALTTALKSTRQRN